MLVISEKQLEIMKAVQSSRFKDKLYTEIEQRLSSDLPNVSSTERGARIEYALNTASQYDFIKEQDIIRYAFLVAVLGTEFNKNPMNNWMIAILHSRQSATARLDQLAKVIHYNRE